jgi:hypothetical protein
MEPLAMMHYTHLDGSDVVVFDSHGRQVPAVDEVRVEPGFAVVSVNAGALAWLRDLLEREPNETLAGAIHSATDGHMHHCGALRVVYV